MNNYVEIGAIGILFLAAIREFFSYLKSRKSNGNSGTGLSNQILKEIQTINQNHLNSLQEIIQEGNTRLIDVIHQDNTKIIELLGEIKGSLK